MENSTKYFNDYDIYESKSCFFKREVDSSNQPFFTEDDFKPDQPEEVVKSFDELVFLYSTMNLQQEQPQPQQVQPQQSLLRRRKYYFESEYSGDYLDMKVKLYSDFSNGNVSIVLQYKISKHNPLN